MNISFYVDLCAQLGIDIAIIKIYVYMYSSIFTVCTLFCTALEVRKTWSITTEGRDS